MTDNLNTFRQEGNQIVHTRLLNAPQELVWEAWTNPEHIQNWFGPNGFAITHKFMEVKPGSQWLFTMHGMGRDWPNQIDYLEVEKPSRLVYRHGDGTDGDTTFMVYVTFESRGKQTLLTMRSVFKSKEILDELNRQVNAIEGGKQTLNRLEAFLAR